MSENTEFIRDYLGDSVYATFDGYITTIYLDNGMGAHTQIVMEPEVLEALDRFVKRCKQASK